MSGAGSVARTEEDTAEKTGVSHIMLVTTGLVIMVFALLGTLQAVLVLGVHSEAMRGVPAAPVSEILMRTAVNFVAAGAVLLGVALVALHRRVAAERVVLIAVVALVGGVLRGILQHLTGIYPFDDPASRAILLSELVASGFAGVIGMSAGLLAHDAWQRQRRADAVRLRAQERAMHLLVQLQEAELRIRQEVAQGIHGSVQTVFVVLEARLEALAGATDCGSDAELADIQRHLRRLREGELRALSGRLYPVDLERGLGPALATLHARMPAHVRCLTDYADAVRALEGVSPERTTQVLIVRIIEEGLVNALRHAHASTIATSIRYDPDTRQVDIRVENDGGTPPASPRLSGLTRLAQHAALLEGTLTLTAEGRLGTTLRARFAVSSEEDGTSTGPLRDST